MPASPSVTAPTNRGLWVLRTTLVHPDSVRGAVNMISIARGMGVRGVMLFSYDWAVASGEDAGEVTFLRRVGEVGFGR